MGQGWASCKKDGPSDRCRGFRSDLRSTSYPTSSAILLIYLHVILNFIGAVTGRVNVP